MVSNFQQTTKLKRKKKDLVETIWNDCHHVGKQHSSLVAIIEGLSYDTESATSEEFSKEKSPERFQLGMQIWQFQVTVQLQLPVNSIPKT